MTDLLEENEATGGMVPNLFKAMAAADPAWLEMNWHREKTIMLEDGPLDKKTRELIAFAVSVVNNCEYCTLAHEAMAINQGVTKQEMGHARQVIELFSSFNAIANSYQDLPCDIKPG